MPVKRSPAHSTLSHVTHLLMIALLCLGIVLQILGAPVSFLDFNDSDDPFTTSVAIGFALPTNGCLASHLLQCLVGFTNTASIYHHLFPTSLFRPPLS